MGKPIHPVAESKSYRKLRELGRRICAGDSRSFVQEASCGNIFKVDNKVARTEDITASRGAFHLA